MNFDGIGIDITDLVRNNKRLAVQVTVQLDGHPYPDQARHAAHGKVANHFTQKLLEEKRFFSAEVDKVTGLLYIKADCVVMTKEELVEFYEKAFSAGVRRSGSFNFGGG